MAAYITVLITISAIAIFAVGFGKFWFERMTFTDASYPDDVNRQVHEWMARWAGRFSSAWRFVWPTGLLVILASIAFAVLRQLI